LSEKEADPPPRKAQKGELVVLTGKIYTEEKYFVRQGKGKKKERIKMTD